MSSTFQPLPRPWAERLIERLRMLYGDAFDRKWAGMTPQAMVDCWAEELAGYTADELKRGLADLKGRPFPPSLPEFCEMCRPSQSPEELFYEAVKQMRARQDGRDNWPTPGLFWAAAELGQDILSLPFEKLKGRWSSALAQFGHRSDPVPAAPKQLPPPAVAPISSQVREAIDKVRTKPGRPAQCFVPAICANSPDVMIRHFQRAYRLNMEPIYAEGFGGQRRTLAQIRAMVERGELLV